MGHSRPIADRMAVKIQIDTGGCHTWIGAKDANGYGVLRRDNKDRRKIGAHRVAYTLAKGEIPDGLHIDHLCRNRACVNPDHLEAVSPGENGRRGTSPWGVNYQKTHCNRGHPFDDGNTARREGRRTCKICESNARRALYQKRKARTAPSELEGGA